MQNTHSYLKAITIDNCILKSQGYKFNEGILAQLTQFKNSRIKFIQTDIVHNESIKHLAESIKSAKNTIEKSLTLASIYSLAPDDEIIRFKEKISVNDTDENIAEKIIFTFYEGSGATILDSTEHDILTTLLDMYFNTEPPFESVKDKKHEFPDAIALIALDSWADENDIDVIAVSDDKGWLSYAENSARITVFPKLAEALASLQPVSDVEKIINTIRLDALFENENIILSKIKEEITSAIESADITVDAVSSYAYESELTSINYISHTLEHDDEGHVNINIVRIDEHEVVLELEANIEFDFVAKFDFYLRDPIDKDYIKFSNNIVRQKDEISTEILITLSVDSLSNINSIQINDIEVTDVPFNVDFGSLEPEFYLSDDDYNN